MLALYHNITVRKRRVLKQRLQIQQRTAADRGHGRQAHTAAGHRIEHPLRNLQEPHSWVLIDAAPEHTAHSWSKLRGPLQRGRAKDAKGNGLLAIRYYGCCVVDSYHEDRTHLGLA